MYPWILKTSRGRLDFLVLTCLSVFEELVTVDISLGEIGTADWVFCGSWE